MIIRRITRAAVKRYGLKIILLFYIKKVPVMELF
jgi:hypothetical protein